MNKNLPVIIDRDKQYVCGTDVESFNKEYSLLSVMVMSRCKNGVITIEQVRKKVLANKEKSEFDKALEEMKGYYKHIPTLREDGGGWDYPTSKEEYIESIAKSGPIVIVDYPSKL